MLDFEISEIAYKPRWLKLAVLAGITALADKRICTIAQTATGTPRTVTSARAHT